MTRLQGAPIQPDWRAWDRLEGVRFTSVRRASKRIEYIAKAKGRAPTARERMASYGAYTGAEKVWNLPAELINAVDRVKPRDTITDDATRTIYTIIAAELAAYGSFWRCQTIALSIVHDLADTVDIERATIEYDAAGAARKVFPGDTETGGQVLYPALVCRVQPQEQAPVSERGVVGPATKFEVIAPYQLAVTTEDRIKWTDISGPGGASNPVTRYLEIRAYHDAERIDELPKITAELMP